MLGLKPVIIKDYRSYENIIKHFFFVTLTKEDEQN